jgi:hypothetical protein
MNIRPAVRADLPAILDIYNWAVLNTAATNDYEPHTLEMRIAWFDSHLRDNYPVFVAQACTPSSPESTPTTKPASAFMRGLALRKWPASKKSAISLIVG